MPGAERPGKARLLLVALQLNHRSQKRPDLPVLEADQAVTARDLGLERDPAFCYAAGFGRAFSLGDFPVAGFYVREARAEHLAHLVATFHGFDVPGEGNKVAPVAFRCEHPYGLVEIACSKRRFEFVKKDLDARIERSVEHHFLPMLFFSVSADVATLSQVLDESRLAQSDFPAGFCRCSAFTTNLRIDEAAICPIRFVRRANLGNRRSHIRSEG